MRKISFVAALLFGVLSIQAQEKVMNVIKKDGTSTQTRVADLSQISFLTVAEGGKGLLVKTVGGETASVLFETNPVVTATDGKLIVKPSATDAVEFEIANIAEILFGETPDAIAFNELKGFACVLQEGGALLRGIPKGIKPRVYSLDGRSLPVPPVQGGELRLNRSTMGPGLFIVKVGAFSTKLKL